MDARDFARSAPAPPVGRGGRLALTRRDVGGVVGPDCPRCGSALSIPAASGGPSESILQLRSGDAPGPARHALDEWLCRSCGLRWPHERSDDARSEPATDRTSAEDPAASPPDAVLPSGLVDDLRDPEEGARSAGVNSRVGAVLRRAREARGITLSEAAKGTYIWERYLEALEADASLEEFPARAYARSFLRAYAEFLELAPLPLLREFDERHAAYEPHPLEPFPDSRPRRRLVAWAMVALSVVSLLAIVVVQSVAGRESGSPFRAPLAGTSAGASGPDPSAQQPPPQVFRGIRAVLRLSQPCWVQAVADGRLLERSTLEPGDRVVLRARRLMRLTLGNAGGVELEVGGEVLATGAPGAVVRLELRLRHGEVVSTTV